MELIPIEQLRPGDLVYGHDRQPHRVLRTICQRYVGTMVELRSEQGSTLVVTADHLVLTTRRVAQLTPDGGWSGIPANHVDRARQLRKESSPPERVLWGKLRGRQLGVKFRRQHQLGPYIADFYSRDAGLVVEIDGETHFTPEAQAYDRRRDDWMRNQGLIVCRFSAYEVGTNLDGVLETIWDESRQQILLDDPAKQWIRADRLRNGDAIFAGVDQHPATLVSVEQCPSDEIVFDLEVEAVHSFVTETCTVHNCGSGTTAYVAEQWGRRWITIDTSRVALALARTRLMAARFPYYLLADSPAGRRKSAELGTRSAESKPEEQQSTPDIHRGFVYKTVPHVTLKSIANNPDIRDGMSREQIDAAIRKHADTETLYDQPYEDKSTVRVCGPFTVESLSPHRELPVEPTADTGHTPENYLQTLLDNLRKAGVKGTTKDQRINFTRLDPFPGEYIQAEGTTDAGLGVRVSIGPEFGTVGDKWINEAAVEAIKGSRADLLLVCAFAFDAGVLVKTAELTKELQFGKLRILPVRMNPDMAMFGDETGQELLKKTGAANLFTIFGEPDLRLEKGKDGQFTVAVRGVDVFDPTTGEVRSGDTDDMACWFLDTDYDGQSFFVRHAYFCQGGTGGKDGPYDKLKKALRAEIDEGEWSKLYATTSQPFAAPASGRIAVKVINTYGDEVLKVCLVK